MTDTTQAGFNIDEIAQILPHRYPFALIDRVISYDLTHKTLHAIKNITINEPVFMGHFPGNPIFPGVLLLEAMAQATGMLGFKMTENVGANEIYLFAGIDNARFKRQVIPGDRVDFYVDFEKEKRGIWKFTGRAEVDGQLAATADLMCARRNV